MKHHLLFLLALVVIALSATGCASLRSDIADAIGPEDVARAEATIEDVRAKLRDALQSADAKLQLQLRAAEAKARLDLAKAKAQFLAGAERLEAELRNDLAEAALAQLRAELAGQ